MTLDPITHVREVGASPQHAFAGYADRIGDWWPATYTSDPATLDTVRIESGVGGRVYERHHDGHEVDWGEVVTWEPGRRLAYTFTLAQPPDRPSTVTVTFVATATGTRVDFEHGGWADDLAGVRAKFGDWPLLLDQYVELVETEQSDGR